MATLVDSMGNLLDDLQRAKENLKGVDEHIKKLIGRDPSDLRLSFKRNQSIQGFESKVKNRLQSVNRNHDQILDSSLSQKKRDGVHGRLGPLVGSSYYAAKENDDSFDEDELPLKPTVASSVIAHPKEQKTRLEVVAQQKADKKSLDRNRRVFGSLMGTLQKFCQEETKQKDKEEKRLILEKKIEEAESKEKEEMKREKQELFLERKRKQAEIRRIEYKMARVREQESWEQIQLPLLNFIQTKVQPAIFFLPKIHNSHTEELLLETQKQLNSMKEDKRKQLEEELEEVEARARRNYATDRHNTNHTQQDDESLDLKENRTKIKSTISTFAIEVKVDKKEKQNFHESEDQNSEVNNTEELKIHDSKEINFDSELIIEPESEKREMDISNTDTFDNTKENIEDIPPPSLVEGVDEKEFEPLYD